MAVGYIQQVAQAAAPAVPPLIANAVLQDHVVRAKGAQDSVHITGRALGIDLVNLESKETELQHTTSPLTVGLFALSWLLYLEPKKEHVN